MSAAYSVSITKFSAGVAVRAKPVKSLSTKARVISGTVGTEVHEDQRIAILHGAAAPMRVALTNSSFSSRA